MDLGVGEEIQAFAATAREALADPGLERTRRMLGGDVGLRHEVMAVADRLGLRDLDAAGSLQDALAAAYLALEVGRVGAPIPLAGCVTARAAGRDGLVQSIGPVVGEILVNHADLVEAVGVVGVDGTVREAQVVRPADARHLLAPYASVAVCGDVGDHDRAWLWALYETLEAFISTGAVEAATALTREHLRDRHQFGKPLASFQALQHRFADMLLAGAGLRELAHYTLWKLHRDRSQAVVDALALRTYHLEAVRAVFRHGHQIHAAIGLCDEHPLSLLSRAVRFSQYVPLPLDDTVHALDAQLCDGFDALFPIGASG